MASSDERMKILKLIDDGKLSVEDGMRLLIALAESSEKSHLRNGSFGKPGSLQWLRVRVTDPANGKTKATVNLPIELGEVGLKIASHYAPQIETNLIQEALQGGKHGKIIDVTDERLGDHVEVFLE